MTLTHEVLGRWLHRGACAITGVFVIAVPWQQLIDPVDYPPPVFAVWAALAFATLGWALADAFRCATVPWGLRASVVVAVAAGLTQVVGGWRQSGTDIIPPLLQAMAPAFGVVGFAFNPHAAGPIGLICGAAFGITAWQVDPGLPAVASGLVVLGSALVAGGAIDLLYRAASKVEQALGQGWDAREEIARSAAKAEQTQLWDGLVHDKVLGALRLAARARDASDRRAAAELAHEALFTGSARTPLGEDGSTTAARVRLERVSTRLGLQLRWEVEQTDVPGPSEVVASAVMAAAEEALVNVSRHSGSRVVTVTGTIGGDLRLDICDSGLGFDPDAARPGRLGIDRGIIGRLTRVGGSAQIISRPGHGATVRLRAPADVPVVQVVIPPPIETWAHRDFLWLFVLGAGITAVFGVVAVATVERTMSGAVVAICLTLVIGLGVAASFGPVHRDGLGALIAVAVGVVCALGTWNLRNPFDAGWPTWYVGALNATVVSLTGRFRTRWGVLALCSATAGLVIGQVLRGGAVHAGLVTALVPQLLAFWCAAWGIRRALDLATSAINEAAAEVGQLRLADARAEEAVAVARARSRDVLAVAGPLLERIAAQEVLDPAGCQGCLLAEAEARDGLVAAPLLTPGLRGAIRRCRERSVTVSVAAEERDTNVGVQQFREILASILAAAPGGSRVNARLRHDQRGRVGSVTMVGQLPGPPGLRQLLSDIRELAGSFDLLVSIDDDLLIELRSPPA
jgi:hypothetical protein